ncbi:hypothetical protein HOO54_17775 [Bacillus sp. WMMC1349]|uniref:hypothetical protein n=1 Tax=Bacillus sp. WMMC1349 TaxID=2736254 RepID=UPI0015557344|nr:hypothetical protein [Bacillus sp. WMMC1349]NPC94016.1 hypothetical protein [Bacillus sp. WMMC1349]
MNNLRQANLIALKVTEKFDNEIKPKLEKLNYGQAFLNEMKRARNLANRNARKLKRMTFTESDQKQVDLLIASLEKFGKAFDHLYRRENAEAQRLEMEAARLYSEFERRFSE